MSAQQQVRQPPAPNETPIFPPHVTTYQNSLFHIQRTVAVCVSSIAFLRNLYPETAFRTHTWKDMQIRLLSGADPRSRKLIKYIAGAFDALENRYLRQIILAVCHDEDDLDDAIEAYSFTIKYSEKGLAFVLNGTSENNASFETSDIDVTDGSSETAQRETVTLLRTLFYFTETLTPLPPNCLFTMKLLYYDERTPADYEPPGFIATYEPDFTFGGQKPVAVKIGKVNTEFHSIRTDIRTTAAGNVVTRVDKRNENEKGSQIGRNIRNPVSDVIDELRNERTERGKQHQKRRGSMAQHEKCSVLVGKTGEKRNAL